MSFLSQDIMYVNGVGSKRAQLLKNELSVFTVEDLLRHYPYKYIDRSKFYKIKEINSNLPYIQIKGKITRIEKVGEGKKQRLTALFSDGEKTIELVWFKGIKFIVNKLKPDIWYVVFGKPSLFNGKLNIVHPEIEQADKLPPSSEMGLQPYYNTTEKMKSNYLNSKAIQTILYPIVKKIEDTSLPETITEEVLQKLKLISLKEALVQIHFPKDSQALQRAKERLKFEELFYIQLDILRQAKWREQKINGFVFSKIADKVNTFYHQHLPFSLTEAQKRVLKEIRVDLGSGKQMNRLLQGDVGSGKTVVALIAMLMALDNDFQACLMAPTEILANQHFETITELLGNMPVSVSLLTGSTKQKDRPELLENLKNGSIQILIGTHALIEDNVIFNNLGLVIIDEQHRFGVEQRSKLWKKNTQPPHILVMTATPIPRTLAMTLYGDLSVSVIDELPPGRKPIQTYHYFETKRAGLLTFIGKQIRAGRQVYVVYPLIEESEKLDLQNLEEGYAYLRDMFPKFKISMVHGKMKPVEKDAHMQKFAKGETQIMVATTVIEVGVNVPNASVMVIESAERFGLSQLHQLRGRVGRGAEQSYCILMTGVKLTTIARQRMEIMTRTNNGFEISEADLRLRGPGDIEGTQQSGIPFELKIADLAQDGKMLEVARNTAIDILDEDPILEQTKNQIYTEQIKKNKKNRINWGNIS